MRFAIDIEVAQIFDVEVIRLPEGSKWLGLCHFGRSYQADAAFGFLPTLSIDCARDLSRRDFSETLHMAHSSRKDQVQDAMLGFFVELHRLEHGMGRN